MPSPPSSPLFEGRPAMGRKRRGQVAGLFISLIFTLAASPSALASEGPTRVVSLNPSLTSILVSLGAQQLLVGVDDHSASEIPEVDSLPRVGGLFSPSLESVLALKPDLVILVPSVEQRDFKKRLEALGVEVESFRNIHFEEVLENIQRLGRITRRENEARERIEQIRRTRAAAESLTRDLAKPRVLVVLQRDPIYVAGAGSFIAEILSSLGASNVAKEFPDPYPRVGMEWVVHQRPEVLIDLSPERGSNQLHWSRWPSIPAVSSGRVVSLEPRWVSMPGPHLDRAIETLVAALYGEKVALQIHKAASQ